MTRRNWPAGTPPGSSAPPRPHDPAERGARAAWRLVAAAGPGGVLRRAAAGGGPGRGRGPGLGRARAGAYRSAGGRHADHLAAESGCRTPRAEIPAVITIRPAELAPSNVRPHGAGVGRTPAW